jgi:glutathione peroxidase
MEWIMNKLQTISAFAALVCSAVVAFAAPAGDVVKDPTSAPAPASTDGSPVSPLDFTVKKIDGSEQKLSDFKGKVVMIVNVASKCGFTKQYKPLEDLYAKYSDQGLVIVGFPANNFGQQEPGTNAQIAEFCKATFAVKFPMMAKISVKGDDKAPLYKYLTSSSTNGDFAGEIGWNFTKFLVDRNGNVIARFATPTSPDQPVVVNEIEKALAAKAADDK